MIKKSVVIDTDIGDDIDDAFAVALALNSKELAIKAIVTAGGFTKEKAQIAHKLIKAAKIKNIPVFQGIDNNTGRLSQKAFITSSTFKPRELEKNLNFFKKLFKNKVNYISLGSLTNLLFLLKKIPEIKNKVEFFIMGGSLFTDYRGRNRLIPEWNIASDIKSSKEVFNSGTNITMVGLDCTWDLELSEKDIKKIKESERKLNKDLYRLYILCKNFWKKREENYVKKVILYDPFTVAGLIDGRLAKFKEYKIYVDDKGRTIRDEKLGRKIKVAAGSNKNKFMKFFMKRILYGC